MRFIYEAPFAAAKASGLKVLRWRKRIAAATDSEQLLHVIEAYRSLSAAYADTPVAAAHDSPIVADIPDADTVIPIAATGDSFIAAPPLAAALPGPSVARAGAELCAAGYV